MRDKSASTSAVEKSIRVALVHDYLREYGGAERVLEALHAMYPTAPVYVAFWDEKALGNHWMRFADWELRATWLQAIPGFKYLYSPLRFLAPLAFSQLNLKSFDVVISSSNAYQAKAIRVQPGAVHICYCHTPPRSLYGYTTLSNWRKHWVTLIYGTIINHFLRIIDFQVAQRVPIFVANSRETAKRISKFYRRDSVIISPPVQVPAKPPATDWRSRSYHIYVNRLALAKHPEIAVAVATKHNLPLVVVGVGPALASLQTMAGPTVTFMGAVSDAKLDELYRGAISLWYPVEDEDFGIVPVEAMAHGVPVLAHNSGGPRETIVSGETGILFDELSPEGLHQALKKLEKSSCLSKKMYVHAKDYSEAAFKQRVRDLVAKSVAAAK